MTDDERFIEHGRAYEEARKIRSELAAYQGFFDRYSGQLKQAADLLDRFLADPSGKALDGRLLIDHLNDRQRALSEPGFFDQAAEFMEKSKRLKVLEERIKNF